MHTSHAHIWKHKSCFHLKFSTLYFHVKIKILTKTLDFCKNKFFGMVNYCDNIIYIYIYIILISILIKNILLLYILYIYKYIYIYIYILIKTEMRNWFMTHRVLNTHKAKSIIRIQWCHEDNPMHPCPSIAGMLPQSYSCDIYIYIYICKNIKYIQIFLENK